MLTSDTIAARVRDSVRPEEGNDADKDLVYSLVDDLQLVGPSLEHVRAILHGIATSHPLAHFGSPGPLVHYVETFSGKGYEDALFAIAPNAPTFHFLWMLGRLVNGEGASTARAKEILRGYASSSTANEVIRARAAAFLAEDPALR